MILEGRESKDPRKDSPQRPTVAGRRLEREGKG
jgi:hypothetical protein